MVEWWKKKKKKYKKGNIQFVLIIFSSSALRFIDSRLPPLRVFVALPPFTAACVGTFSLLPIGWGGGGERKEAEKLYRILELLRSADEAFLVLMSFFKMISSDKGREIIPRGGQGVNE